MAILNMKKIIVLMACWLLVPTVWAIPNQDGVRLKELSRVVGVRDNSLIGYGLVTGLSGTGDTIRSRTTTQSIANTLRNLGLTIEVKDIASRNVAAVIVSATLPPFARPGDKLDINVTSMGDAKSLLGGTLALTRTVFSPILFENRCIYFPLFYFPQLNQETS